MQRCPSTLTTLPFQGTYRIVWSRTNKTLFTHTRTHRGRRNVCQRGWKQRFAAGQTVVNADQSVQPAKRQEAYLCCPNSHNHVEWIHYTQYHDSYKTHTAYILLSNGGGWKSLGRGGAYDNFNRLRNIKPKSVFFSSSLLHEYYLKCSHHQYVFCKKGLRKHYSVGPIHGIVPPHAHKAKWVSMNHTRQQQTEAGFYKWRVGTASRDVVHIHSAFVETPKKIKIKSKPM